MNDLPAIAQQCLHTLADDRVLIPASGVDAIATFKNLLRQMATGQLVLQQAAPQEPEVEPPPDES